MNQKELQDKCQRLMKGATIEDCIELINIFLAYLFETTRVQKDAIQTSRRLEDARIINQMMFSKLLHLRQLLMGARYESEAGVLEIIDPTIIASLVRNIYETTTMFHLIYITPNSTDKEAIMYNLWVIAGLKFRQRFVSNITTEENERKSKDEANTIMALIAEIHNTDFYKSLSIKGKNLIGENIKQRDYKVLLGNGDVKQQSWQTLSKVMGYGYSGHADPR